MKSKVRVARCVGLVFGLLMVPAPGHADGGVLRLRESRGGLAVSVFTAPEPLRVGLADLSVLVQRSDDGSVLLDAEVNFTLSPPDGAAGRASLLARRRKAANLLMQSAEVSFPVPGVWELSVSVRRGDEDVVLTCLLKVAPPVPSWVRLWPLVALAPLAIALFAANQALKFGRARALRRDKLSG